MKWKLNKKSYIIILTILLFFIVGFKKVEDNSSKKENFFDIFSPDNLQTDDSSSKKDKSDKAQDFTVYGLINVNDIKKVIIKPKKRTYKNKKNINRRGYIILKVGEKYDNYELINIENDVAIFKNNDKILRLSVFNEDKKDRISSVTPSAPQIIGAAPITEKNNKLSTKTKNSKSTKSKKNNFYVLDKKNKNKANISTKKQTKSPNMPNSFLELLKKAKKAQKNRKTIPPSKNPFLRLFNRK